MDVKVQNCLQNWRSDRESRLLACAKMLLPLHMHIVHMQHVEEYISIVFTTCFSELHSGVYFLINRVQIWVRF